MAEIFPWSAKQVLRDQFLVVVLQEYSLVLVLQEYSLVIVLQP